MELLESYNKEDFVSFLDFKSYVLFFMQYYVGGLLLTNSPKLKIYKFTHQRVSTCLQTHSLRLCVAGGLVQLSHVVGVKGIVSPV